MSKPIYTHCRWCGKKLKKGQKYFCSEICLASFDGPIEPEEEWNEELEDDIKEEDILMLPATAPGRSYKEVRKQRRNK